MKYLVELLFEYGFIFLFTYFIILVSVKTTLKKYKKWIVGFLFALELLVILLAQDLLGWNGLPDGRYVLIGLSVFFWGFYAFIPLWMVIILHNVVFYPDYLIQSSIIVLTTALVFHLYKKWLDKRNRILKWYHMILNAFLPTLISMPFSIIFYQNEAAASEAQDNILVILINVIILTFIVFYANNREIQRNQYIQDLRNAKEELTQQNEEIHALYEEITASEETLQANYDELSEYKNKLEYLAYHHPKTGLYTKKFLIEQMHTYTSSQADYCLFYIKVHDLEHYIETLGHNLSDILHAYIGKIITNRITGHSNIMIYDLSGGRYALIINSYEEKTTKKIIQSINDDLSRANLLENLILSISIDVGAVELTSNLDPAVILEYAETAMIEASKHPDQLITWFSQDMFEEKRYLSRLEIDLQHAIDHNQMFLVYQPQYNIERTLVGVEALLRWQHPDYGLISPSVFIPLAETIGCINQIGQYVLRESLKLISEIKEKNLRSVPIAINASFLELINPEYAMLVKKTIESHKVNAKQIHIEITETAFSNDINFVMSNILDLVDFGVEFHLDDFGTGYSSLSYLSQFPVKVIKIDKSFIDLIADNNKIHHVVKTIIELAHRLDMKVIAEGVEEKEQVDILSDFSCDYYQGYYFSKPISKDQYFNGLNTKE